jgi:histidyl-tRNA synthetase
MAKQQFQTLRGMYDILPDQQPAVIRIQSVFQGLALEAGYKKIETPILEQKGVFVRGVGEGTDIVDKELFAFTDRSNNEVALRPEPTAGVVRAYIEHGMASRPQPVKLQIAGPMFRYDRPQAGRQRQFNQLGVEVIGEASPSMDAQIIMLALRFYRELGIRDVSLQINSIGDAKCRPAYKKALVEYFEEHQSKLCETCQARLKTNPLRILDCKDKKCQPIIAAAPQTLDHLCKDCHEHFTGVLEYLDHLHMSYELNPQLVRGLDYYTRTVFEFYGQAEGAQSSLGGGGRYDGLVELLGGKPTPAVGFGLGLERILLELESTSIAVPGEPSPAVYVASLGEPARLAAYTLIERFLDARVSAVGAVDKDGIGTQLERANKLAVPYAVIIGQKEVQEETVILRDMRTGAQEMIPLKSIVKEMTQRFS